MRKYNDNVFFNQEKPQTLSGNGDIRYLLSRSITFAVRILILIVELFLLCCLHTTHSHSRCRFQSDFWLLLHVEQKATLRLSLLPFYRDVKHSTVTPKTICKPQLLLVPQGTHHCTYWPITHVQLYYSTNSRANEATNHHLLFLLPQCF